MNTHSPTRIHLRVRFDRVWWRRQLGLTAAILLALGTSAAARAAGGSSARMAPATLAPGEIVYADSGNAIEGGFIYKINPANGAATLISVGGFLQLPFGVAIEPRGNIIVSDSGRLLRIDPTTGAQTVILDNSDGRLGYPLGLAVDRHGDIIVANLAAVLRVNPHSQRWKIISTGGYFHVAIGVAVADDGYLFVVNRSSPSNILRVHPQNGRQTLVSGGGLLHAPQSIAIHGDQLYVTDVASPYGDFGTGRVIRIDAHTGSQVVLAEGGWLVAPVGVAIQPGGWLAIADPYTINPDSTDLFDGGIVSISEETGEQLLLARGRMGSVNPRGIAVVPAFPPGRAVGRR